MQAELGGGGGFAGALQAGHQHHRGRAGFASCGQGGVLASHGFNQLLVHQLDKFLIRANAPHHLGAHGLAAHLLDEVLNHRQAHIRLQQGSTHLLERAFHVGFRDRGLPSQTLNRLFKSLGKLVKHRGATPGPGVGA